jgi:hypothetical protein
MSGMRWTHGSDLIAALGAGLAPRVWVDFDKNNGFILRFSAAKRTGMVKSAR